MNSSIFNMIGILVIGIYILSSKKKINISHLKCVHVYDNILNVLIIYQYLFKVHAIYPWINTCIYQIIVKNSCFLDI